MNRAFLITALCLVSGSVQSWGETPSVQGSSAPVISAPEISTTIASVAPSTAPPTVANTGESISIPPGRPMTKIPDDHPFITRTRTGVPAAQLPSSSDFIYPEKSQAFDALNAGEALTREAGVQVLSQGSSGYPMNARIRGASPKQSLILLDGRPLRGFALGAADLSEIPSQQIDHIEIVRGGLSSLYGPNALGGVINVITKRASYTGYPISHVGYEGASYKRQTYKLDAATRVGPADFFFYGDQQSEHGFRGNADNSQFNIGGNAGLSMGEGGKLLFDGGAYHDNAGLPGMRCNNILEGQCVASTTPLELNRFNSKDERPPSSPNARETTESHHFRGSYLLDLPKDMFLAIRVFGQERELDFEDRGDTIPVQGLSSNRHEQSKGAELQWTMPLGLTVGGSFLHDHEDYNDRSNSANSFAAAVQSWGVFVIETIHWNAITLIPSARFERNSQFGESTNPRVEGIVDATNLLRFSASAARAYRPPTIDEWHAQPQLRPEHGWTYDAGFEVHPDSYSFRATYFLSKVTDLIQTTNALVPVTANIGTAKRQGAEIQIDHVLNRHFRDGWNYTYLENHGILPGSGGYSALPFSPKHSVNFFATITPKERWSISPTVRYLASRFSDVADPLTSTMGSTILFDLRVAYEWRQMEVYVGMNDITDRSYEEQAGFPLPGRTAYIGIKLRLWG